MPQPDNPTGCYEIKPEDVGVPPPTDALPAAPRCLLGINDVLDDARYEDGFPAIPTGYDVLDRELGGGFRQESLFVLAGRTGAAKSTMALNIARRVALDGHRVLVLKLEESPREAVYRLHAAASQVPLRILLNGASAVRESLAPRLDDARKLLGGLPLYFSDVRTLSAIRSVSAEFANGGGELVVIDQFSIIIVEENLGAYERATAISNALRLLARDLHVPILVVAQVNREAAKAERALTANALRDSGSIENDAAAVILIDKATELERPPAAPLSRTLDLLIAKNRYGQRTDPDHPLQFTWWPETCRIEPRVESEIGRKR